MSLIVQIKFCDLIDLKSHKLINIVLCLFYVNFYLQHWRFSFLVLFFSWFLFLFFLFFNTQTFEEKEHFSTYALNSKTGATHWKHEPGDYEATKNSREVLLHLKMSLITMQIFSPKSIVFVLWSVCTGIICNGLRSSRHQQKHLPRSVLATT